MNDFVASQGALAEANRLETISALKVFYYYLAHAEQDLMLGRLHPGGGQYDCLSIIDSSVVLLYMNRGASATAFHPAEYVVRNFREAAQANVEKVAAKLFAGSKMRHSYGALTDAKAAKLRMIGHMIGLLEELAATETDLLWGFFDSSSEGAFSNFDTFPSEFPSHWQDSVPVNSEHYDWSANILQVASNGQIVATYNQQTAEVLLGSGRLVKF